MNARHGDHSVFICHAREDRETVAGPLAAALTELGVSVWLDVERLRIGDRVRPAVDLALATCRIAVVIFSPSFYRSRWAAEYELDGIITRLVGGDLVLLPILHDIDRAELRLRVPSLGFCVSRSTAEFGVPDIAREIARIALDERPPSLTAVGA